MCGSSRSLVLLNTGCYFEKICGFVFLLHQNDILTIMPYSKEEKSRQKADEFRQQMEEQNGDENNNDDDDDSHQPCCVPSGCTEGDSVNVLDPDDAQKVVCNNPGCIYGSFMHKSCFEVWEEEVLTYLRSSGRARSWSEKQRKQNLWTKKGYDLAWKACSCKCGKGHLRKDLEWIPPPKALDGERKQRRRRKSSDKPSIGRSNSVSNGSAIPSIGGNGNGNGKGRKRHTSASSNESKDGHSPPVSPGGRQGNMPSVPRAPFPTQTPTNSTMTPTAIIHEQQRERIRHASGGRKTKQSDPSGVAGSINIKTTLLQHEDKRKSSKDFAKQDGNRFTASAQGQNQDNNFILSGINTWQGVNDAGNLNMPQAADNMVTHYSASGMNGKNHFSGFLPRLDLSTFFQVLPAHKLNAYHIQMEDDIQPESEEIRSFIFSTVSAHGVQTVRCSQCSQTLPVFDCYPLIDGTFYLTPVRYGDAIIRINIPCSQSSRGPQYLAAVCMKCLEGVQRIVCRICKSRWDGSHYQLGTLYSYDIFAASPCCPGRAGCKRCGKPVLDLTKGMHYFSEFSQSIRCPHCGIPDYHCVKPLTSYEVHLPNIEINVH